MPADENPITVMPYMMAPGVDKIVAPPVYELLMKPAVSHKKTSWSGTAQAGGQWDEFLSANGSGCVQRPHVLCRSNHRYEGTTIGYTFEGLADGGGIRGSVDVG